MALYVTDHLNRQLAPTAALAAAAAVTSTLRIGPYVWANDFRHPLLVAREAATLDRLSGGRFDLGLGAGWRVSDYRQLGIPYDRPGVRIDRLAESLGLIQRLLGGEKVTHAGPFLHARGCSGGADARAAPASASCSEAAGRGCCAWQPPRPPSSASCPSSRRRGGRWSAPWGIRAWPSGSRSSGKRRGLGSRELELNVFVADAGVVGGLQPPAAVAERAREVSRAGASRRFRLSALRDHRPAARVDTPAAGADGGSARTASRRERSKPSRRWSRHWPEADCEPRADQPVRSPASRASTSASVSASSSEANSSSSDDAATSCMP